MASSHARGSLDWILGKFSSWKELAQAARAVEESPSLQVVKECGDVALGDVVSGELGGADGCTRSS